MPSKPVVPPSSGAPSWLIRLAVWASAILVVLAGGVFYYASYIAQKHKVDNSQAVVVTISGGRCEPNELTVPAGRTAFQIVNRSQRAVEWEILDGVMVLEERENIAPGFTQNLTARLEPGDYAITCGLLSNPRGTLHVTPSDASAAQAARPPERAYIGPLAEYRVYLMLQASELAQAATPFAQAIQAGDLAQAKALYASSRMAYMRIAPVADMFSDLDQRIDARAGLFEKRENDTAFAGFHRLEYGLFQQGSTQGLEPVARQLLDDVKALQARIHGLNVPPRRLAHGAARVMRQDSAQALSGDGSLYSHTDLSDMQGNVQGAAELIDLLRPLLAKANGPLLAQIDSGFKAVNGFLARHRQGGGYIDYSQVPKNDRQALAAQFDALATDIEKINTALGLD